MTLAEVTALVDAHSRGDHDRFRAVTLAVAANVASKSPRGAEQLRRLVERQQALVPVTSAGGLISVRQDLPSFDDMVLAESVRESLARVVREHERRLDLIAENLWPSRKLLLTGPSGVGKTMAAGALALAVRMPLFRVELHAVIASHLGETAANLAKVFDHVRTLPGVYLFDEFDALCSARASLGNESAGAEMRRVVNSLLQFVEDDRSDGLIVATTNHPQLLDDAIFRRFDEMLALDFPADEQVVELIERLLGAGFLDGNTTRWPSGISHADVRAAVDRVRKERVLDDAPVTPERLVAAIRPRTVMT